MNLESLTPPSLLPSSPVKLVCLVFEPQISIGDIAVVARLNWLKEGSLDGIPATIVDDFPLLLALVDCVMSDPKVVAYTESRAK